MYIVSLGMFREKESFKRLPILQDLKHYGKNTVEEAPKVYLSSLL